MSSFTTRPVIMGTHGVVTSGHYLASQIGLSILQSGGNAVDSAAATGFALAVLEPHLNSIAGEAPVLVYDSGDGSVSAVSGQGVAPAGMTIDWFAERGIDPIPGDGLTCATVPAAVATWIEALIRFGTLSLRDLLEPAIELAESGFPVYGRLRDAIAEVSSKFLNEWPSSAAVFLPHGRPPLVGELLVQTDWAATFKKLIVAETEAKAQGRVAGLEAARSVFYRGDIAERIAAFAVSTEVRDASGLNNSGFLSAEDLAGYRARVEPPVSVEYRGLRVHKCNTWSQGPVLLQQLRILEGFDLVRVGHNSADCVHTLLEAAKLAFADREVHYGDPDFVGVLAAKLQEGGRVLMAAASSRGETAYAVGW